LTLLKSVVIAMKRGNAKAIDSSIPFGGKGTGVATGIDGLGLQQQS
jgi:hypothetical protein